MAHIFSIGIAVERLIESRLVAQTLAQAKTTPDNVTPAKLYDQDSRLETTPCLENLSFDESVEILDRLVSVEEVNEQ